LGTRTVIAIRIDCVHVSGSAPELTRTLSHEEAAREGWFNGSPYAVAETVFDEEALKGCTRIEIVPKTGAPADVPPRTVPTSCEMLHRCQRHLFGALPHFTVYWKMLFQYLLFHKKKDSHLELEGRDHE